MFVSIIHSEKNFDLKKLRLFSIIGLILFYSCTYKRNKYISLDKKIALNPYVKQWKLDSLGCLNLKPLCIDTIRTSFNFKKLHSDEIERIIGKPNYILNKGKFDLHYYCLNCIVEKGDCYNIMVITYNKRNRKFKSWTSFII